jgi:hypothetical protein
MREVRELLAYGSREILGSRFGQLERLQIGAHDIGDAADFGGGREFVVAIGHKAWAPKVSSLPIRTMRMSGPGLHLRKSLLEVPLR